MIERERQGSGGVRIGDGSLYDWFVEEMAEAAAPAPDEPEDELEVEAAMELLAGLRHRRRYTALAEAAFDEVAREMAEPPRRRRRTTIF